MKQAGEIMVARRRRLTLRWSNGDEPGSASPTEIDFTQKMDVAKLDSYSQTIANAVHRVGRAIVSIQSGSPAASRRGVGLGSGVVITPHGLVLTSAQVVHDSSELTIRFPDGQKLPAQKLAVDLATDLAVLSVSAADMAHAALGDSSKLKIGDTIIAVGNTLGHHSVVSTGVVTTLGRALRSRSNRLLEGLIQHTAHSSAGVSGGALLDTKGNIVGLLTDSIALGQIDHFAISAQTAAWALPQLNSRGAVRRGRIGVSGESARLPQSSVQMHQLPQQTAVVVLGVEEGGPAQRGGLQPGDWIVGLNEQFCTGLNELHVFLADWPLRRPVFMTVLRGDEKLQLEIHPTEYGA
jgi:S1-C subfamily serine protease